MMGPLVLPEIQERFWSRLDKSGDCWTWTKSVDRRGYGKFYVHRNHKHWYFTASRVAWMLTHGEIPAGLSVCHHCDNPPCCNPAHLFLGTAKENSRDCWAKGRASPPPIRISARVWVKRSAVGR